MGIAYYAPKDNSQESWESLKQEVNPPPWSLFESAIRNEEGRVVQGYNFAVETSFKSRIPKARYIVVDDKDLDSIWWKHYNPMAEKSYLALRKAVYRHLTKQKKLYSVFCTMGNQSQGFRFNVLSPLAWWANAAKKLFFTPGGLSSEASWAVVHAPDYHVEPRIDCTNTGVGIIINFSTQEILILGTSYVGELKTALHSATTYFFPNDGLLPLHAACSINAGGTEGLAIVGLSGNGKSAMVNDSQGSIYADDLVVVDGNSGHVLPLETGCHVKIHGVTPQDDLYDVIENVHGAIFENVEFTTRGKIVLNGEKTSTNARLTIPLIHHPHGAKVYEPVTLRNIVFLCADVTGVMPLIAKLSTPQAVYTFLNAPAARGMGVLDQTSSPELKFATAYGPEFLTVDPLIHARLLQRLCEERGVQCWLVSTGWDGEGNRIPLATTRAAVRAIARNQVGEELVSLPVTGLNRPLVCKGVEPHRLDPLAHWSTDQAYLEKAEYLAEEFRKNAARKFGRDLGRWVYDGVGALAPTDAHFAEHSKRG